MVPEGAAVYGLTRQREMPLRGLILMSQAEALEISLVPMVEATAQRRQVNSRGADGTLYSSGSISCSSSHVFLGIQE